MYLYVDDFSLTAIAGEKSYLTVNTVSAHTYQYAFFATQEYINRSDHAHTRFNLIPPADDTYRIQYDSGFISYLAVSDLDHNTYQYAFFANQKYIDDNKNTSSVFRQK
jgi:hypothetical protein